MKRVLTLFLLLFAGSVSAIPQLINYQGQLTAPDGTPLTSQHSVVFHLYSESTGGSALWEETHAAISVNGGLFHVLLGSTTSLADSVLSQNELWLGLTVDADSELLPRVRITSVPYALRAEKLESFSTVNVAELLQLFNNLPDADGDGHTKISMAGDDCDDLNAARYPGALEICDGVDNDCDGVTDPGFATFWYRDLDGDGYSAALDQRQSCTPLPGYSQEVGDCDDNDPLIIFPIPWYSDLDHDGYGNQSFNHGVFCPANAQPEWVSQGGDCDDTDSLVHPGATEICDDRDNDCSGFSDDGLPCDVYMKDTDQDGYGDELVTQCRCAPIWPFTATVGGDCDDFDADINPGHPEVCANSFDDDCDGLTDGADTDCP